MDGMPNGGSASMERLAYPFASAPESGQSIMVAPGVHWLRMPVFFDPGHVNVWVLDDGDGWAIVDTGLRTEETSVVWRQVFANARDPRPVSRIFATHMHADHVGMAGWLTRKFGVQLWMTALEYLMCRVMVSDTGREAPQEALDFFRRAGWTETALETYRARFGNFGNYIHPLPDSFRRIEDDEELEIGANKWRVLVGRGHSPAHACLYCASLGLLISGDQILPGIASNISVFPTEPDADPMGDWLASLERFKQLVPDDVLVLPAHGECFRGLHARIDALVGTRLRALDRLRATLRSPQRVVDVFSTLFRKPIVESDTSLLSLATGESLASLNYLLRRGEAVREASSSGATTYRLKGSGS